jgi:predicted 3-demethylubiquinone-9 3-methyltransferase (glyoxalase superfamily)
METQNLVEPKKTLKGTDFQKITPFLWFNNEAEQAVKFYASLFKNSEVTLITRYEEEGAKATGMPTGSIMTMAFTIEGQEFVALNGGPVFQLSPIISFFVHCNTMQEIDLLWEKLSQGGNVMMTLDKYPFAEKYGWIQDKFGVSWQLIFPGRDQKVAPCFMFTGKQHRKAEEAIHFYLSVFKNSELIQLERYGADQGPEGAVVHSKFTLEGQEFIAMDSHMPLEYDFNPAISFVVNCKTQQEIDYYWTKLSEGGDERAQQCGWLQDKYGVSWQIVPYNLSTLLNDPDPDKAKRVMHAMLKMKKMDINALTTA